MTYCPACGQRVTLGKIEDAESLYEVLSTPQDGRRRDVYRGQDGGWYITYRGGEVSDDAVRKLVAQGRIRRTYSNCADSLTAGRTIDCDATDKARKSGKDRKTIIYVGDQQ